MHRGYLLDTRVVSALAAGRKAFVRAVLATWLQAHHEALKRQGFDVAPVFSKWPGP